MLSFADGTGCKSTYILAFFRVLLIMQRGRFENSVERNLNILPFFGRHYKYFFLLLALKTSEN
jgi:hypothetical protein